MCVAVSVTVCYSVGGGTEMLMCAAVSVMVCYSVGVREGNDDVSCS